jgi:predicted phage baseplate assembly protein
LPLPAPNLDDRRFQDLVDDAKRLVQRRCPEWTDHNVSDPGVTLIETVAYMTDQLIYRLNRVPDRNYVKFLELIGVRLFPPNPAKVDVTYWLSARQDDVVVVPAGAEVGTVRTESPGSAIAFTTERQLDIVPCELAHVGSIPAEGRWSDHTDSVKLTPFSCFSIQPAPGDVLLIGLSTAVPRCAVSVRIDCSVEGVGVDPEWPPLVWEAFDGQSWSECEVDSDTTMGLNQAGDIVVHVPATHAIGLQHQLRAGWIRARVTTPEEAQPFYSNPPLIKRIEAFTIGGTVDAVQAEVVEDDVLGICEGVPGERFEATRAPVVRSDGPLVLQISDDDGWQEWSEVHDFSATQPSDRHFVLDATTGEVRLGPAVRTATGELQLYGAVPAKGAVIRIPRYHTGGGQRGNVAAGAVRVARTTVPFVTRVQNRHPASGGVDGETVEEAKVRGPLALRTLGRAVTVDDYEQLAREVAPAAARLFAVGASTPEEAGGVRVLVVPAVADNDQGRLSFEQLIPPRELVETIKSHLQTRRTIGARVMVEPPSYQGVTVVAVLRARPWADPLRLQLAAIDALYGYLHPISGGPDAAGWPFGRAVSMGEIHALLQRLRGTDQVEDVRLFAANPITGEHGPGSQRVGLAPNALVFSYEHQVQVRTDDLGS